MERRRPARDVGSEFLAGMMAARDPENRATAAGGTATTTARSPWYRDCCPVCRHTFRRGDEVLVEKGGSRVVHASAELPCARGPSRSGPASPRPVDAFFRGLDASWPPPDRVIRLGPGHELLAEPPAGCRRRSCAYCGHTFRRGDTVIVCPCYPPPGGCSAAVHRDPQKGLHCWEELYPEGEAAAGGPRRCPVFSRVLDE